MFAGGFFFVNFLVSSYFFRDISAALSNKNLVATPELIASFKWAQLTSSIISFVIPALLLGYYSSPKALPYVGMQPTLSPVLAMAAIVFLVVIQPFVGWLGNLNAHIKFGSYQKSIDEIEALYTRAMEVFLQMKSVSDLMINLLIMALLPAIGEELFFRGSLQKVLLRLSNQPWLAIFISAGIFALLHNTFLKIIPIFTLGLFLGIIYHITRNLWYTIIIHFLNNSFAVLAFYYADKSEFLKKMANDSISIPAYSALISVVIGIGIIYLMKRKSDQVLPEAFTNEDNDYIA